MVAPRGNSNTDRGGASTGVNAGSGGFKGPGVSGLNSSSRTAASSGAKSATAGKGPAASQAAAKANAAKTQQTSQQKSPVARSVPGTSQAAAKNTALGKAAQVAKQNVKPSGTNTGWMGGGAKPNPGYSFSQSQNAARVNAVRRGPGVVSGAMPGNTNALAQRRTLTSFGNSIAENPAFNRQYSPGALNMLPKAVIGEAQHEGNIGRAAVANVMMNRLALGASDPASFGYMGAGSIPGMMRGIDAAGVDPNRPGLRPNAGYRNTRLGTENYADGLRAVADSLSPYSEFSQTATPRALNATHYYNDAISNPKWGEARSGTPFDRIGNHVFGNAERTAGQVAGLRAGPPAGTQMASAAIGSIPRPRPRPDNLGTIPRPTPRPGALNAPALAQNPYAANYSVGVPRARPPGIGPERVLGVENYIDPNTGITRNPFDAQRPAAYAGFGTFNAPVRFAPVARNVYDTQRAGGYAGYGNFNTLDRTAPLTRNAFDTQRATPAPSLGYGPASPLGSVSPAAEQPRLVATMPTKEPMGHWKREEQAYLNQIGAWDRIQNDPAAKAGYEAMQSPYGTGLMLQDNIEAQNVFGRYVPRTNEMSVRTNLNPAQYGQTVAHELGHAGTYKLGGYPFGPNQEEVRQRVVDAQVSPMFSAQGYDAQGYLANPHLRSGMGMAFTPPIAQTQKDQARIAETPGPVQQYGLPAYPGAQPAGTYTAPYDRAPRMSPFGNVGQEYHQHTAPPTPSQYRNEMPPAAPNMGTPGSQTAETAPSLWQTTNDLFQQAKTAAEPYVKQAQEGSEELKKAVETYGEDAVLTYLQQQAGQVPQSLRGYGEANENQDRNRSLMAAGAGLMGGGVPSSGGQPSSGGGSLSQAQMTVLLANMQANGATPEEIAYVQSMMATATA